MTSKKIIYGLSLLFVTGTLIMTSCKKKTKEEADTDTTEASDHALAENISSDILHIASQAADNASGGISGNRGAADEQTLSYCATVKRDSILKIDSVFFSNSTCLNGRTRNGILIFNYSASLSTAKHYRDPGFKCSVTSANYSVDGNAVNIISKTIQNTTPVDFQPNVTNLSWQIDGHITVTKAQGVHDFTFNRTKILLNTADPNVYHGASSAISWNLAKISLSGSASGTTAKGKTYTATITSPLIRDFGGCKVGNHFPFIQGKLELRPATKATRYIDFGNGSCDVDATVTINGVVHNITLP